MMKEQPRVPAGSPEGGQWADAEESYQYNLHFDPAFEAQSYEHRKTLMEFWHFNSSVNGALRGTTRGAEFKAPVPKEIIARLDKAFETAPKLKVAATVYRGVDLADMKLTVGSTFEDKGYACSSMDQPLVVRWVKAAQEPAVMAIRMPKGTKYLAGDTEMAEIIPNRGSRFKVLRITRRPGKVTLIDLEML